MQVSMTSFWEHERNCEAFRRAEQGADPALWIGHSPPSLSPQRGIIMEPPRHSHGLAMWSAARGCGCRRFTVELGKTVCRFPLSPIRLNARGVSGLSDSLIVATYTTVIDVLLYTVLQGRPSTRNQFIVFLVPPPPHLGTPFRMSKFIIALPPGSRATPGLLHEHVRRSGRMTPGRRLPVFLSCHAGVGICVALT
jgi:hypothetical protein